jgi:ATP-dependent exoDNAse (exonuclease V) beta subunit
MNVQLLLRKKVKIIRENLPNEDLLDKFHEIANILSIEFTEKENNALIETISNDIFIKQFTPLDDSEVQVMTLHKSKGLELKCRHTTYRVDYKKPAINK